MRLSIKFLCSRIQLPMYVIKPVHKIRQLLEDREDITFAELQATVDEQFNAQRFIVQNLCCTGEEIPRDVYPDENAIVVRTLHGKTSYVRISLE